MSDVQTPSGWPDATYREAASAVLAQVESQVDRWLEADVIDIDAARSGGMLTLILPNQSQVIINMQPPLHELWLAARQGGYHFKFAGSGLWRDTRDGRDFLGVLSECLSSQSGQPLSL